MVWGGKSSGVGSTANKLEFFVGWKRMNHQPRAGKPPSHSATPELLQLLSSLRYDFRTDAARGKDFEKQRMRNAAVDQVYFPNTFIECIDSRKNFGNHSSLDDFVIDQFGHVFAIDGRNQRVHVFHISHDTHYVTHIDHLRSFQRAGHCSRRHICVDVENCPIFSLSNRRDHRHHFSINRLAHTGELQRSDFPHKSNIEPILSVDLWWKTFGLENVSSGKSFRVAAKFVHRADNTRTDHRIHNLLPHLDSPLFT